jgi:hypothetical protein
MTKKALACVLFGSFLALAACGGGGPATVRVEPAEQEVSLDGGEFTVEITVDNAEKLGAFEFILDFDDSIVHFVDLEEGPFLSSTGKELICPDPIVEAVMVRFGCASVGTELEAPSGSGALAVVTFSPLKQGVTDFALSGITLTDPLASIDMPFVSEDGQAEVVGP